MEYVEQRFVHILEMLHKLKSNVPGQVLRPFCLIASGRNGMCRNACNGRDCMQVAKVHARSRNACRRWNACKWQKCRGQNQEYVHVSGMHARGRKACK
jgi:hypothetical protein